MNLYNITNKVTLTVEDFALNAFVREFRLHGVEVTHSTIGMLNPNTIRLKLNTVNQVIVTLTNVILQKFELPGMIATYGKGRQVKLEYDVLYVGDFRSRYSKDYMINSATVNVKFWVVQASG